MITVPWLSSSAVSLGLGVLDLKNSVEFPIHADEIERFLNALRSRVANPWVLRMVTSD